MAEICVLANDIEIRPAKAGDSEQLWPLVEDFAFSYRPERSAFERSFSDLLDRSDTLVLVAVSDANTSTRPNKLLVDQLVGPPRHDELFEGEG